MEVLRRAYSYHFKFGPDRFITERYRIYSRSGCPVCVFPMGRIDVPVWDCSSPKSHSVLSVMRYEYADVLGSLEAKARGADVRCFYSPLDTLNIASNQIQTQKSECSFHLVLKRPCPSAAITLQQAKKQRVKNFVVCQNITIIPTLHSLLSSGQVKIDGFIAPGHVSMVVVLNLTKIV